MAGVHPMNILGYTGGRDQEVAELILSIQNVEAGLGLSVEDQPDLRDIADAYRNGGFWIAVDDREAIVGTIGLLAYGRAQEVFRELPFEYIDPKALPQVAQHGGK